jgi:pimeloyl-ACP methyl ester carboxylesterase
METNAYVVDGPETAPAVVLVHGSSESGRMWQAQMEALRADFRVVAPDLPGHGRRRAERFTVEGAMAAVNEAIQGEGHGRALLVGHSLGGYLAMLYAERHPERVAGLALDGCSVAFRGWTGYITRVSALTYNAMVRVWGERAVARYVSSARAGERSAREGIGGAMDDGHNPAVWGQTLLAIVDRDFRAVLRAYRGPVLIITGARDKYNERTKLDQARSARDVRLRTIAGAGHACMHERPDVYTRAVREFAEEIGWAARGDQPAVRRNLTGGVS